ncbi:CoA-binding protein [bacterium]|nr:CoA-binding protein [bacterium]
MLTQLMIDQFLANKTLVLAGVSRSGKRFGNYILKDLAKKGFELLLVHPEVSEIKGQKCYASLSDLPVQVGGLVIVVPPEQTQKLVEQAYAVGINNIWMQQGSESPAAIKYCLDNSINLISGECILMFAQPGGIHKFHCWIWNLIGKLPKQKD